MMVELIILANSVKHKACCVAGKTLNGNWIRIVSDERGKELEVEQASIKNPYGKFPVKPLQKVKLNLALHAPLLNQPENYVNDVKTEWIQNYKLSSDELSNFLDSPANLWGDNTDRVLYSDIEEKLIEVHQSLYLIRAKNVIFYSNLFGKRRVSFCYNELSYDLSVTSPNFDIMEKNKSFDDIILCISLGEIYDGSCYKIVANIFR